jgi:hypothetical protein
MSINQNNAKIVEACNRRLIALNKHVQTKGAMTVSGKQMKPADIIALYQAALDTRAALVPLRAMFEKALVARDEAESARAAIDKALKAWVVNEFGPDSSEAAEFGFAPAKVTARTAEAKALAAQKLRATRVARGTKGKREKQKIKGTLAAPAAPSASTTTAPAAPAASVPAPPGSH